jgi:hypothetical protein
MWSATSNDIRRRWPTSVIAAASCAAAIAACGSSGSGAPGATTNTKAASSHFNQALQFSACMRSHGVPNFPDPTSGGGIQITSSSGINPFSPSFKSAQSACRKSLPGGGPGSGQPSAQAKAQMLAISQCMRAHGITAFPDPTTTAPSSPNGYSAVIERGGVVLAIPDTIDTRSPAFRQAAATCHFGG